LSVLAGTLLVACGAAEPAKPVEPLEPASNQVQPSANRVEPKFRGEAAWGHLEQQIGFGPRPSGSAAIAQTRAYLLAELKAMGIQAREQAFEGRTPNGPVRMVNVIATIPGRRPDRLALASHFDTKRTPFLGGYTGTRVTRFVGASDGASSTAVLLELGRALAARQNEYTIELIFFDGEEAVVEWQGQDNTYGSRHYVQAAQQDGSLRTLKALVLLDMVGDKNLNIKRETTSTPWLTDTIWAAARGLGYTAEFNNELFTIGGDDHFPFLAAGIPAVDIIDFDYPHWHEATDDIQNVSRQSLQVVGNAILAAIGPIEQQLQQR
jgi:glutaminyl-peptide cyclotransferase